MANKQSQCHPQCVRIGVRRYGRDYVIVESLLGDGDREKLGMTNRTSFLDKRPLLDPARPEIRHYRFRFWHDGQPAGDRTAGAHVTVSP